MFSASGCCSGKDVSPSYQKKKQAKVRITLPQNALGIPYLSCSFHQSRPLYFREKTNQKITIKLSLPNLGFGIIESEREVIRIASFGMAGKQVVGNQANHDRQCEHRIMSMKPGSL